eukprot:TRINITY_DN33632_c0_g1_i1.p1 TRINITY_DN33632_c0_g1~~TRINITY_DN33632_c0_g1_i1.p1  ORF type:complete len:1533 (-),score=326.19 TRINITY_DN33632_c0_g1_i1:27-4625(-)
MAVFSESAKFCSLPRREAIFVDEDEGEGLELSAVEEGMLVQSVLEFPGQGGLQAGDVIAAMDEVPLSAAACGGQAGQEMAFRKHLRHGASITVLEGFEETGTARFRCPRCWRGYSSWPPCLRHHVTAWRHERAEASAPGTAVDKVQPTSGQVRTWMERAMAAAREELPRPESYAHRPPMPAFAATCEAKVPALAGRLQDGDDDGDSSGSDEVFVAGRPLLSESKSSVAAEELQGKTTSEDSKALRLAAARTRMQSLGCAKKERKACESADEQLPIASAEEHSGAGKKGVEANGCSEMQDSKNITSVVANQSSGSRAQAPLTPPTPSFASDSAHDCPSTLTGTPPTFSGPEPASLPGSRLAQRLSCAPSVEEPAALSFDRRGDENELSESDGELQPELPQRSWWSQFFQLRCLPTAGAATLRVSLSRMKLRDADMPSLTAALELLLEDLRGELGTAGLRVPLRILMELDLSDNRISDSGTVWLVRWLLRRWREVRCRAIRLARNRLGNTSLEWLAALIQCQHSAVEEIHLTKNKAITDVGAATLLLSIALHPHEAYPWLDRNGRFAPAWVNLDQNSIQDPSSVLARLKLRAGLRAVCNDGPQRGSSFMEAPHLQLGAGFLRVQPQRGTSASGDVLPLSLEKVCTGGPWPPLQELPKPVPPSRQTRSPQTGSPQLPPTQTFRRELLVDEEEGAGLQLETINEGLRVDEIMSFPGQPGLRTGDIIVAADGLPLWWIACEFDELEEPEEGPSAERNSQEAEESDDDVQSARFRARFRRGARLDVLRQQPSKTTGSISGTAGRGPAPLQGGRRPRFCCPVCWDSFDRWNDCLQHIRELGHEPKSELQGESKRHGPEDTSTCMRRWMSTCMAAARGELPQPPPAASPDVDEQEEEKAELLLTPAAIGFCGDRNRTVVELLAEEASRMGIDHGCIVWALPDGLQAQCSRGPEAAGKLAAAAADLLEVLHYYLPDIAETTVDDLKDEPVCSDLYLAAPIADDWDFWLENMLQQQVEEVRPSRHQLCAEAPPFVPQDVAHRTASLRVLVLCGLPGSGKSSLATRLSHELGWTVVNQDSLGSRQACMKAARAALKTRQGRVVIDRCNANAAQRAVWVQLAMQEFHLGPAELGCVWLDVSDEECGQRVLARFGHATLPPREASLKVIRGFTKSWQPPASEEGFARVWRLVSDIDMEGFWAEIFTAGRTQPQSVLQQHFAAKAPAVFRAKTPADAAQRTSPAAPADVVAVAPKVSEALSSSPVSAATQALPKLERQGESPSTHVKSAKETAAAAGALPQADLSATVLRGREHPTPLPRLQSKSEGEAAFSEASLDTEPLNKTSRVPELGDKQVPKVAPTVIALPDKEVAPATAPMGSSTGQPDQAQMSAVEQTAARRVVEFGAGYGVGGMAFAMYGRALAKDAAMTLTTAPKATGFTAPTTPTLASATATATPLAAGPQAKADATNAAPEPEAVPDPKEPADGCAADFWRLPLGSALDDSEEILPPAVPQGQDIRSGAGSSFTQGGSIDFWRLPLPSLHPDTDS